MVVYSSPWNYKAPKGVLNHRWGQKRGARVDSGNACGRCGCGEYAAAGGRHLFAMKVPVR